MAGCVRAMAVVYISNDTAKAHHAGGRFTGLSRRGGKEDFVPMVLRQGTWNNAPTSIVGNQMCVQETGSWQDVYSGQQRSPNVCRT